MMAEEADELGKAALKVIRAEGLSDNPTPISLHEAIRNFYEEFQDVLIAMRVLVSPSKYVSKMPGKERDEY